MVLQSTSGTDRTLSELLRQLQDSTFAGEPEAQRIAAACTVLLAPSSRNRLLDVRHHCSLFAVPRRIEGSPAYRSLSDLCANLTEVLCARAVEVLSSRGAGASEDLSMQAGSASEHREGSASSASEHVAGRAIAPRMETSDDSSKHASKASDHLSTETVADGEHAPSLEEVLVKHGVYTSDLKTDIMRWMQQEQMFIYPMSFSF